MRYFKVRAFFFYDERDIRNHNPATSTTREDKSLVEVVKKIRGGPTADAEDEFLSPASNAGLRLIAPLRN